MEYILLQSDKGHLPILLLSTYDIGIPKRDRFG